MPSVIDQPPASPTVARSPQTRAPSGHNSPLADQFHQLRQMLDQPVGYERRQYARIPLQLPLQVTPLDQTGQRLENLSMSVLGKDISPGGVSFYHDRPIPHRRAIVTIDHPELGRFTMEVDIRWCQYTGSGSYVSGCRMIRANGRRPAAEA